MNHFYKTVWVSLSFEIGAIQNIFSPDISNFFLYRNWRQYHAWQSPNYEIKDKISTEAIEKSMVTL